MDGGGLALDGQAASHRMAAGRAVYATAGGAKEVALGKGKNPADRRREKTARYVVGPMG